MQTRWAIRPDSITLTRYFVVADGNVSGITDARNEIQCVPTGTLHGTVTANSVPVSHAAIAVLGNTADGPGVGALTRNVLTHTRTDTAGNYSLTVPPGSYTVVANLEGSPYEGGGSSPLSHPVVITAFGTSTQDVNFPQTGALQVTVDDGDGNNIPAKVSIVGFDPSPDPFNTQNIAGLINTRTAVFAIAPAISRPSDSRRRCSLAPTAIRAWSRSSPATIRSSCRAGLSIRSTHRTSPSPPARRHRLRRRSSTSSTAPVRLGRLHVHSMTARLA